MKPSIIASLLGVGLVSSVAFWSATPRAVAQADRPPAAPAPGPAAVVVAPGGAIPPGAVPAPGAPAAPPAAPGGVPSGTPPGEASAEDLQLSFQGANVDMVVQWLAKVTGKTVVKHPRVQCQVTVVGSKKMTTREAISVVYRALSLEGFTAVETSNSIMLVPEGQDVKMSPEVIDAAQSVIPEGRQKLIKIFALTNLTAVEMKEKIRGGISDKGTIDVVDRSNQLMVTDLTDNLRLVAELIKALDVPAAGDASVQFYSLKYSDAEEIGNLMNLVLNAQAGSPSSSSGGRSSSRPGMPMMDGMPPGMPSPGPSPSGGGAGAGSGSPLQIRIWPDKVSNRLIVAAPKARFQEVEKLLATLDTEKPRDVTIRVLPLKNVSAEDLVREIGPMYQKGGGGKTGKEGVEITANSRSNSLIIFSSESNYNEILKLVAKLDTDEAQEKVMETFPLKNADAEDTAKQLQDIYKDDSNSRYPYYYFSSSMGNSKDNKKVKVVADRRRNAVIVQAPPAAMENLGKLIATLDEPSSDNALAPKIYKLKYVNAMDLEDVLNELFLKKPQQRNYYYFDFYDGYSSDDSSSNSRDSKGGKLYGKVRITSEPYSNSLIISANSAESLKAVEDVVKELDAPSEAGESTFRVGLKFAKARDVASSLNILFAKAGSPPLRANAQNQQPNQPNQQNQQNQPSQNGFSLEQEAKEDGYFPWLGGQQENTRGADGRTTARPVSDLVGKVRVVPDKRINSLLISCNMHFLPQVMKLITDLDAAPAQVLIEAKIIEVASDFRDKLGVRWSPDGAKTFDASDLDGSMAIKGGATYNKVFTGSTLADALKTGVLSSSVNLDVLIQFMRKTTDSRVLAEPQISIADNELGKLFVGSQVPFISGSLNTDVGGRNDTFQYKDVGIILEVTPRINDAQEVALRIRAESSSIRSGETLFGGAILDTRNFRTDVMVKSGETVVLGGIIQREESNTLRKTPGLGSVPGLGWAFKKKDKITREVELMVFLRPWVSRGPEDTKKILDDINRKAPLINQTQEADAEQKAKAAQEAEKRRKR